MDALLILSGIVVAIIGWLWLVITSLRLPVGKLLLAALLPVLTLFRRDQGYARAPRLLLTAGCLTLLVGLAMLFHLHPHRFEKLVTGQWQPDQNRSQTIDGEIMGQRFRPERVFWRGDDLVLEEGPSERVRRSLKIRFAGAGALLDDASIALLPNDPGAWPEVIMQWHVGALESPGLRRVTGQYSLNLDFAPAANSGATLRLHLTLPSQHQTWITGEARLDQTPAWLEQVRQQQSRSTAVRERTATAPRQSGERPVARWQAISVLAVLDEPSVVGDAAVRVTTVSGRAHEGRFKGVTDEGRIVLAQAHGPNQVDLQFHPVDIRLLETFQSPR
ncbi:hypothetical protein KEM63_06125 [Halopseudomonas nanhaiensis]|uniref:hypothetical protein n=1 Tax=Halopseudomonas nanhaiensis TaxID=2830842 RepID=UPI001CBA7214|nr:hypothetical protein [Halopseudomonas nanhaiensis]UAW99538.1 hypothetical protein KEM63_06125 [Halopseudomonas nanhaiensis]